MGLVNTVVPVSTLLACTFHISMNRNKNPLNTDKWYRDFNAIISTISLQLEKLEQETVKWCREILRNSPTAIRVLKSALNAVDDGHAGLQVLSIIYLMFSLFCFCVFQMPYIISSSTNWGKLIDFWIVYFARNLEEMQHSYSMELRKVTRGGMRTCNVDRPISPDFLVYHEVTGGMFKFHSFI